MSEDQQQSFAKEHKFLLMIGSSIVIALVLVVVSMSLYYISGAAQLDLSRPGLSEIREQVSSQEDFEGFEATGEINSDELDKFEKMYNERFKEIQSINAFSGDVLSPETLQINDMSNVQ